MLSRRHAVTGIAGALSAAALPARAAAPLSAREVFAQIKRASDQPWDPNPTDDRIIFRDRAVPVTGIATCFFASIDVLRRAKAAGLNYVIPHEASFFERYDDFAESALLDNDPVIGAKQRYLTQARMVIQRMHSHAHSRPGDAIMTGLLRQLAWEQYRLADKPGMPWLELPPASALEVGRHIKRSLGRRTLRMRIKFATMVALGQRYGPVRLS